MKSLVGALVATVVGIALLVIGFAGTGWFDEGGEMGSSSDSGDCSHSDPRIKELATFNTSAGLIVINCEDGEYVASFAGDLPAAKKPRTVALWLYNSRKDFRLVGGMSQTAGEDGPLFTGDIPEGTARFGKWAVSVEAPGDPERPTKVIETVAL